MYLRVGKEVISGFLCQHRVYLGKNLFACTFPKLQCQQTKLLRKQKKNVIVPSNVPRL